MIKDLRYLTLWASRNIKKDRILRYWECTRLQSISFNKNESAAGCVDWGLSSVFSSLNMGENTQHAALFPGGSPLTRLTPTLLRTCYDSNWRICTQRTKSRSWKYTSVVGDVTRSCLTKFHTLRNKLLAQWCPIPHLVKMMKYYTGLSHFRRLTSTSTIGWYLWFRILKFFRAPLLLALCSFGLTEINLFHFVILLQFSLLFSCKHSHCIFASFLHQSPLVTLTIFDINYENAILILSWILLFAMLNCFPMPEHRHDI